MRFERELFGRELCVVDQQVGTVSELEHLRSDRVTVEGAVGDR